MKKNIKDFNDLNKVPVKGQGGGWRQMGYEHRMGCKPKLYSINKLQIRREGDRNV